MVEQDTTQINGHGRLRVLFVSDHFGYAGGVIHGATRYFQTVLPRLIQHDIELHVAFLRGDHPASEPLKQQDITPSFFNRSKWNPLAITDLLKVIRRHRIQVIHCAGMKGILTSRLAGRLARVPVVAHLHDYEPVPGPMCKLMRMTDRFNSYTLAVSGDVLTHTNPSLGLSIERSEVLHNGLVLSDLRNTPPSAGEDFRHRFGLLPESKVIGIIGRLMPVKGHDTLLRAMPTLLAKQPDARLLIVGDGTERQSLTRRVTELGLDGYVTFTGQIDNVYEALRATDVVAMPSLREGLPYSLLEAMAMDVPVVASAVGGLAETIRHCENGVLVRPGDAQALAEALNSVLADQLLRQTVIHGGHDTADHYDIDRHVDRLRTIYHALAEGRPVPPPAEEPTVTEDLEAELAPLAEEGVTTHAAAPSPIASSPARQPV